MSLARRSAKMLERSFPKKGLKDWIRPKGISKQVARAELLDGKSRLKESLISVMGFSESSRHCPGWFLRTALYSRVEWPAGYFLEIPTHRGEPGTLRR